MKKALQRIYARVRNVTPWHLTTMIRQHAQLTELVEELRGKLAAADFTIMSMTGDAAAAQLENRNLQHELQVAKETVQKTEETGRRKEAAATRTISELRRRLNAAQNSPSVSETAYLVQILEPMARFINANAYALKQTESSSLRAALQSLLTSASEAYTDAEEIPDDVSAPTITRTRRHGR